MSETELANWIAIISGLVAAGLWLSSALVRVPNYVETMVNEPRSIPWIIKRQSRFSAVAAIFTAISVFVQAAGAFLRGADITPDQKQFVVSNGRTYVMVRNLAPRLRTSHSAAC